MRSYYCNYSCISMVFLTYHKKWSKFLKSRLMEKTEKRFVIFREQNALCVDISLFYWYEKLKKLRRKEKWHNRKNTINLGRFISIFSTNLIQLWNISIFPYGLSDHRWIKPPQCVRLMIFERYTTKNPIKKHYQNVGINNDTVKTGHNYMQPIILMFTLYKTCIFVNMSRAFTSLVLWSLFAYSRFSIINVSLFCS